MSTKKLLSGIRKADELFSLFEDGDVVAVGLSGGKDSTMLLEALCDYRFLLESEYGIEISLLGIHIDLGFGEEDLSPLFVHFRQKGIPVHVVKTSISGILKQRAEDGKISCSLCALLRRGAFIDEAASLGVTKAAYGHSADDAIETLFLNMIHSGKEETFEPKMTYEDKKITFIRPFYLTYEKDIRRALKQSGLQACRSGCPNDAGSGRNEIRKGLSSLYHRYPHARENFFRIILEKQKGTKR